MTPLTHARRLHAGLTAFAARWIAPDALPLLARLTLAGVFWRSLLTKVSTVKLFTYTELINDFEVERSRLRLPELPLELKAAAMQQFRGDFALPLLPPDLAAWMATLAELVLPVLLVLGILTRISALALVGMTLVIQVFVYPEAWWATHALWVVIGLYIAVTGPGRISIDHQAARFFAR
ncbi:DoxX family protein [Maricaulis sp.]|uniref:DoxX family protein n=1 Tax=Maricaulis sp. TaxID=1486257 RepID=UPI002B266CBB|nr:DoxX family membrane protein [Maricaulis sp.]